MSEFSFSTIQSLVLQEQKEYLKKYFIPLKNGDHLVLGENNTFEILDDQTLKKVYFRRLTADLNKFYFTEYTNLRRLTCEFNKPREFDNFINICPQLKATYKPYKDFSKTATDGVELFLLYIKEVLASDNEECYIYLLKWIANMLKGNKNTTCLYLKGAQRIGKSTLGEFLKEHVMGLELFLETGSAPLKSNFNKLLMGRLLVVFEELENFNMNEWSAISSTLKRKITSSTDTIESKGKDPIQIRSINNYILNSNNDAIRDDEGQRYFIADVSHKYQNNKNNYFSNLHNASFNDEVGCAFYSYMLEYNTQNFNPQEYPDTKSKLNSIARRLDSVYKFIKDDYVLTNTAIFKKPKEIYDEYVKYCNKHLLKNHDLIEFKIKMTQINIEPVIATKARTNYYKISNEELKEIADSRKWIHENDIETNEHNKNEATRTIPEKHYQELIARIAELESQLENKKSNIDIDAILDAIEESFLEEAVNEISDEFDMVEVEEDDDEFEDAVSSGGGGDDEDDDDDLMNDFINRVNALDE